VPDFNPGDFLITITTLLFSIAIHEWAHAVTADFLGDDTPRRQGRVTLWPPAHWDPLGTVFMVLSSFFGVGIGWGKPVVTNPTRYTRLKPLTGDSVVAFAGPLSNFVLAGIFAVLIRVGAFRFDPFFAFWADHIVLINLSLFCFNLIPVYPLDGSHLMLNAISGPTGENLRRLSQQFGPFLLLALAMGGIAGKIIGPLVAALYVFLMTAGSGH